MKYSSKHFLTKTIVLLLLLLIFEGCLVTPGQKGTSKGSDSSASSSGSGSTSVSSSSCQTTVIDYGEKLSVAPAIANFPRGTYSDVALVPGTSNYAVAYSDGPSFVLKLSYWDGSSFNLETIAGESAATYIRIAFLSTKIPIVFWTSGTRFRVAVRNASLTSVPSPNGTWSVSTLDSAGGGPRAVSAAVSPLDDVAVVYSTGVGANDRVKFAFCPTTCSSASQFQVMTPGNCSSLNCIENTQSSTALTQTGVAWCKSSSTVYYPVATYGTTAAVRYAVCAQSSLTNCLSTSNWSGVNVAAFANSVGSDVALNTSTVGDIPKVVARNSATTLTPYLLTAGAPSTACTSTPTTFTAGTNFGNYGSLWFKSLIDGSGKFHVVANNAGTGIYYFNNLASAFNGAWNAFGTIDTFTAPTAYKGGAVIDTSNAQIYTSYSLNSANYDLKLNTISGIANASNSANVIYSRANPDPSGIAMYPAAGTSNNQRNISIARTSAGLPAVAYVDYSVQALTAARLKYALRSSSTSSSSWPYFLVDDVHSPQYPSLAFDENNKPWISVFDANDNKFKLATNSQTDGSGTWVVRDFPYTTGGAAAAQPAANNTALAMYYSGGIAHPVMFVIDSSASSTVRVARFDRNTGNWAMQTATQLQALGASRAAFLSADYDSSGNIVATYYELTTAIRPRYVSSSNGFSSINGPLTVGSGTGQGMGLQVKINPFTSKPVMVYYDRTNNILYFASCTSSISGCASAGWSVNVLDSSVGISGLSATGLNDQMLASDIVFTGASTINVLYVRGAGNDGSLIKAVSTNGGLSFTNSIFSPGVNGNLPGISAANFGVAGWAVSATKNASDNITAAYIGPGNWMYSTSCGD